MTPEQRAAMREGRLDLRCRKCGLKEAAGAYCSRCLSTDVDYRIHVPSAAPGSGGERVLQWCKGGPDDAAQKPPRRVSQGVNAPSGQEVVSEGLWP